MPDTFLVTLPSGSKVELHELNGLEQVRADMNVPAEAAQSVGVYYRVTFAISSIDGESLAPPTSRAQVESRMQRFRGTELDILVREYYSRIGEHLANLPKESAPSDEQPSL